MSFRTRTLLATAAVLAGLFAMHGLAGHQGHEMGASFHAPAAAMHHHDAGDGVRADAGEPGMGDLCLAVLGGGLLLLLLLAGRHRRPVAAPAGRHPDRVVPARGRDPAPPSLARLSVLRC